MIKTPLMDGSAEESISIKFSSNFRFSILVYNSSNESFGHESSIEIYFSEMEEIIFFIRNNYMN